MKNLLPALLGSLLLILVLFGASYAQIGEVAGPLNFNVSIGTRQSLGLTIVNGGSTGSISYMSTPTITTVIPNSTTPQVTVTPMNGTIPPRSMVHLNVTVYMPGGKNRAGMVWNGYISTVELTDNSVTSGANIQAGALKIMTITAAPPKFQEIYILIAALAVTCVGVGAYQVVKRQRAKKVAKRARTKAAVKVKKAATVASAKVKKAEGKAAVKVKKSAATASAKVKKAEGKAAVKVKKSARTGRATRGGRRARR